MVKTHVSVAMSVLQYFKHVSVKPESATDEQLLALAHVNQYV